MPREDCMAMQSCLGLSTILSSDFYSTLMTSWLLVVSVSSDTATSATMLMQFGGVASDGNSCRTLIGVHEVCGIWNAPKLSPATILFAPLSSCAYLMITYTHPTAGNLPIKILVAKQHSTK